MVPVLHDLGSGLFMSLEAYGLRGEPIASEAVREGATVVSMSGDKLLGGPQAGILLGRADAVARMRRNPLARALRVDKVTLAALEATLALYRDPARARREIPALAMLTADVESLRDRAAAVLRRLEDGGLSGAIVESEGSVGGGAFPAARLPSVAIGLPGNATATEARLRAARRPIIGRIANDQMLLDLRSVPAMDDEALVAAVLDALA
jgi:L-seryl-tRNA(Ser) seleniumtransferase